MDSEILAALQQWRARMERNLRAEYSWLALSGLFWLQQGENAVGSAPGSAVQLPARVPAHVGAFSLKGSRVSFQAAPGVDLKFNLGEPLPPNRPLKPDASGEPDLLFIGDLRLMLLERGDQFAIRVWDPQHPKRLNFDGRIWFAPHPAYRIPAVIQPYAPPKSVMIDDIIGIQRPAQMHAALSFELHGQPHRLDAELLDSGAYYVIFKDATAGQSTYPAGRYLVTAVAEGDQVVMDFNRAYNPPCAFTDFATCPLPLPQNIMHIPIEAGERFDQPD